MKLWGLSDVHVRHSENREILRGLRAHPKDWLILCGDVGETLEHLRFTLGTLAPKFDRLLWVPGNHELWTLPENGPRGEERYLAMVELCRSFGAYTPEDPFVPWPETEGRLVLAPLFLLYDYSFAPEGMTPAQALEWSAEAGIVCADEALLHPDPYPSRQAWCAARVEEAERKLAALEPGVETVLINHFPLRHDLVWIPRVPRFIPWCGTRKTEDWHRRFHARVVVSGHLHVRTTQWKDGTRFEEVSLGYPSQWFAGNDSDHYLREIWPGDTVPSERRFHR